MSVFVRSLSSRCLLSVFTKSLPLASALLTSNLWVSGIAIARYNPRSLSVSQVDGMAFFSDMKRLEYVSRIAALSPESSHCWGIMTVDQGLHHLNLACGSGLRFYQLSDESYFLSRALFRWVLVDCFPEQQRGLRLPAGFKIPHDQHYNFREEQAQLTQIIDTACRTKSESDWRPHSMFGKMSLREWGKLLQIHVDYHLRQFGVSQVRGWRLVGRPVLDIGNKKLETIRV